MSTEFYTISIIELLIFILLLYCFMHEEEFITFEQHVKRIVKGNYKRVRRLLKKKLVQLIYYLDDKQYQLYYKKYRKYSAKLIEYRFF
jgi:hypothetical protein